MRCAVRLAPAGADGYRHRTSITTGVARARARARSIIASPTVASSPARSSAARAPE